MVNIKKFISSNHYNGLGYKIVANEIAKLK